MSASVPINEYSYDSGRKPYVHDRTRGKWHNLWDFYFVSIAHSFGYLNFVIVPFHWATHGGIVGMLASAISLFICVIPIFFIQSALGQFSSTGFLSVFRISPMFKGVGYIILILNCITITYYSVEVAIPLVYIISSLAYELPWMHCGHAWNDPRCTEIAANETSSYLILKWGESPALDYFMKAVFSLDNEENQGISWHIVICLIPVWLTVTFILKDGIKHVAKFARYSIVICAGCFAILFIRCAFLPNAVEGVSKLFEYGKEDLPHFSHWIVAPIITATFFGNGWGTILTLASYNNFKADVEKYSVMIPVTLLGLTFIGAFFTGFVEGNIHVRSMLMIFKKSWYEVPFVLMAHVLGTMKGSQLWCFLFYVTIFLFEINALIVQVFSLLTALFDEYIILRSYKRYFTYSVCGVGFLVSILYATWKFSGLYELFLDLVSSNKYVICFCEMMIVCWIYGRERFQRDISFILDRPFSTWKFLIIRFISPIIVLFLAFVFLVLGIEEEISGWFSTVWEFAMKVTMKILIWIVISGYMIYKLYTTPGTLKSRFQKCTRPNDWYPAEAEDRQKYEGDQCSTLEISHQLIDEDNLEEESQFAM